MSIIIDKTILDYLNTDSDFYIVDEKTYAIQKCRLVTPYDPVGINMLRIYKSDDTLDMSFSQGYNIESLSESLAGAEQYAEFLSDLYTIGFYKKPFIKSKILRVCKPELIDIELQINKRLKDHSNFEGIDFCDVGAHGIQIRGHHKEINGYVYGNQITINYDLSNYPDVINEFVDMWNQKDTIEQLRSDQAMYRDFAKYGCD